VRACVCMEKQRCTKQREMDAQDVMDRYRAMLVTSTPIGSDGLSQIWCEREQMYFAQGSVVGVKRGREDDDETSAPRGGAPRADR